MDGVLSTTVLVCLSATACHAHMQHRHKLGYPHRVLTEERYATQWKFGVPLFRFFAAPGYWERNASSSLPPGSPIAGVRPGNATGRSRGGACAPTNRRAIPNYHAQQIEVGTPICTTRRSPPAQRRTRRRRGGASGAARSRRGRKQSRAAMADPASP
jgi:hypothetical protein